MKNEWTRTDLNYLQRRDHLKNGGGYNLSYKLTDTTVPDDGSTDQLTGGADMDWFWANLAEITDKSVFEPRK